MREKKANRKKLWIFLILLLFSFMVTKAVT